MFEQTAEAELLVEGIPFQFGFVRSNVDRNGDVAAAAQDRLRASDFGHSRVNVAKASWCCAVGSFLTTRSNWGRRWFEGFPGFERLSITSVSRCQTARSNRRTPQPIGKRAMLVLSQMFSQARLLGKRTSRNKVDQGGGAKATISILLAIFMRVCVCSACADDSTQSERPASQNSFPPTNLSVTQAQSESQSQSVLPTTQTYPLPNPRLESRTPSSSRELTAPSNRQYRRFFHGACEQGSINFHFIDRNGTVSYRMDGIRYIATLKYLETSQSANPDAMTYNHWGEASHTGHPNVEAFRIARRPKRDSFYAVEYRVNDQWYPYPCLVQRVLVQ
jgi:hypothetical protein